MRQLAVISKLTGVSSNYAASEITLNSPSIVKLSVQRDEISQLTRVNQDLVITLKNGETITVKNFYVTNGMGESQLVLEESNGALWWVEDTQAPLHFDSVASIDELVAAGGAAESGNGAIWTGVLGALAVGGGIAAMAAASGGGDNDDDENNNPGGTPGNGENPGTEQPGTDDTTPPAAAADLAFSEDGTSVTGTAEPGSTVTITDSNGNTLGTVTVGQDGKFTIPLDPPLLNGETITAIVKDPAGNTSEPATATAPDITDPLAITDLVVAEDGASVSGTAEPGSTVTLSDADGNILGTIIAGKNGQFTLPLNPPLLNGETVTAIVTDTAGNTSEPATAQAPDTTAPQAITDLTVAEDGASVSGTAEPGSTVTLTDADGNTLGTIIAGENGQFTLPLNPPLLNSETVTAIVKDAAGNNSEPATATAPDNTAPDAPLITSLTDTQVTNQTTLPISGTGEPGSEITLYNGNNVVGTAEVDADGNWTVIPDPALAEGIYNLTAVATDPANNISQPSAEVQLTVDTTAPQAITDLTVAEDGTSVTGTAEAGSTVTLTDADGNELGTATAGENGAFTIALDPALLNGETVSATATDAGGNTSEPVTAQAPDTTVPQAITDLTVADDGASVTGTAEAGSTVTLTGPDGSQLGTTTAGENGAFTIALTPALLNGETVSATVTDAGGNTSEPATAQAPDNTAPVAIADLVVADDGASVTGTAEPGSTVTLTDADGNELGTATAGDNGAFTITLTPALLNGETVSATVTDTGGNASEPATAQAPDTTAPAAITDLVVADDGASVTGTAEAGSTVTLTDANGNELGTATAGDNGAFTITLDPALLNGETVSATVTDAGGNASEPATAQAPDTTAPAAIADLTVADDGASVTGTAEAGSTVTLTGPDGSQLGTTTAGENGAFTITLDPALLNGETVSATATDAGGNTSEPVTATAPDTTAPQAIADLAVAEDGASVTGTAEAGSTVTLTDADGNELGTATASENGAFTITLDPALLNGETVSATVTDAGGNTSEPATATAPDTTAPQAIIDLAVADDGASVSGTAEAGSTVTLTDADGNTLGTATAGENGAFNIALDPALLNGETVSATATDAGGNTSEPATAQAPDTTAPQAITDLAVADDGASVTGTAEAGSTVTLTDADGNPLGTATAGENGAFTIALTPALLNGETVSATATDAGGNTSEPATAQAPDTTAPVTIADLTVAEDGASVTGTAEAGSTVTLTDSNGNTLGTATAGENGAFTITLEPALLNGETVSATATDTTGNTSEPATATAPDTTAPVAITDLVVAEDGASVTGTAEAGSTVTLTDSNGNTLGTTTAGENGAFTITLDPALLNGETVSATVTDAGGNTSEPATATAPDTTAPVAITDLTVADDGASVTGTAEAGSTVTLTDADGNTLGTATAGEDGQFTITLEPALLNGETVSATVTDAGGNTSESATATAPDTTAPLAIADLTVAEDGASVSGTAEAGSTVTLTDAEGNELGTAIAGENGAFTITLDPALLDGETVSATVTDAGGNTSEPVTATAPDTTAPQAIADLTVAEDGASVTGTAEAGSTVTLTDADGNELGTATAGENGAFTITLDPALLNGETVSATVTDAGGNTSEPATANAPDTTAPVAITDLVVAEDGASVTGTAEAGSTVTLTDADGNELGTATAGENGAFTITLTTALLNGETVSATATDTGGNTSEPATAQAPDTTAPVAITDLAVADDGASVTGTAEAGSTVALTDANGNELGTATAGEDGAFTITLDPALLNGETVSATATDAGGNTSEPATATAPDTTAPQAITDLTVAGDGTSVSGTAEAGSTVTLTDADGNELGTATASENGAFTITLDPALLNGETVSATATDAGGNTSEPATAQAPDTTVPQAITDLTVADDGASVTGTAEAGSTVTLTDADGNELGTATAGEDGQFTIALTPALLNGETVSATATDAGGNTSEPATANAPDTTAPVAIADLTVADDGASVTGTAEAGSTVTLTDADGNPLGTATAGENGAFTIALTPALLNGETVSATATDTTGNTSEPATAQAPDTTAPDIPVVNLTDGENTPLPEGQPTRENQPLLSGTGTDGDIITIYDNDTELTTVTVTDGVWSFTPSALDEGLHVFTITAADAAGNTSEASAPVSIVVDTIAPQAPNVTITDDVGIRTGSLDTGEFTDDTLPQLSGSGNAGETITITLDGAELTTLVIDDSGRWSYQLTTPLETGDHTFQVSATDRAGNTSELTERIIRIDTLAPAAPTLTVSDDDSALSNGAQTNDTTPALSGTVEAGSIVTILNNGVAIGTANVNGTSWDFTPTTPLAEGTYNFTVTAQDSAGNISLVSETFRLIVDTTAPAAPFITSLNNQAITNQPALPVSGTGEPGSSITLYNGDTVIGTATVTPEGDWTVTPDPALTEGNYTLTAVATDPGGNASQPSAAAPLQVDLTAPAEPSNLTISTDGATVSGNAETGSTVIIRDSNGAIIGSGVAVDNSFAITVTPAQTGTNPLTATAQDAAGNTSDAVDFTGSGSGLPVITAIIDNTGAIQGELKDGQTTDDTQPQITGTGEQGATMTLYVDGAPVASGIAVQPDGTWTYTLTTDLAEGAHSFYVIDNDNHTSATVNITVVLTLPTQPAIDAVTVTDDVAPGIGALTNGQTTNDARPTLSGTGTNGETISIYDGGNLLNQVVVANGVWTFTPAVALSDGSHSLTITTTDAAGNTSPQSDAFVVVVDTAAPVSPVINAIIDDVPNITGTVASGQRTNDAQPELRGTSEPGALIQIYDGSTLLTPTPVQADASGAWRLTLTTALTEGTHNFTATATDLAGNISPASAIATIVVDLTPPETPTELAITSNGTRVTGTAEAGSTVTVTNSTGTVLGTGVADGTTGSFNILITPAQVGGEALQVVAQDRAGNAGAAASVTAPFTGLPGAPVITSLIDEEGSVTGPVGNGQITNDVTPLITGTGQPLATIIVYSDGVQIGTTSVNEQGSWSLTPEVSLADGPHAITATATNSNGTGTLSATYNVTVDTVTPAPTGTVSADGASISGTAEAGSTVTLTLGNGATVTTTANSSGNYTYTFDRKQTSGENIGISATDVAGNTSTPVQVTAPTLPVSASDNIVSLELTSDATVTTTEYSDYGLLLVGALGNVANVLGDDTASTTFTIQEGSTADLVIDASTTGVVLSLLSTQEVAIQKYDAANNAWTTVIDTAQPQFANLLTLGSSGITVNVDGLTGGTYRVLTYNTALLATGSYTALNVSVEETSAGTVTAATPPTGNVLDNDSAPQDTVVTTVTNALGETITLGAGTNQIAGQYGTLTINQDGTYSYALNPDSPASVIGRTESFTYNITGGGNSASAQLAIKLGPDTPASSVTALDNVATLPYDTHVEAINNGPSSQGGFTVVNVSLGNVLDLGVLDRLSNPIIFDVEEGSTRTMTLQSSIGGVAVASSFDLYIYRFNDVTQQFEQWRVVNNWLNAPLLGGQSDQLRLNLPGGEYLFLLNPASGVTALTGYTLNVLEDHVYSVESLSSSTQGNVLNDDIAPAGTLITQVNGVEVGATGTTDIAGAYGTLTIDAQGNYTYTLRSGTGADSINVPDSFIYTATAPNGDTDTASLNITPAARALDAVNDVSDTLVTPTAQDTTSYLDTSVGVASWGALGRSGSGSGTFDVADGTILKSAAIVFNVSTLVTLGTLTIGWSVLENGTVIRSGSVPVANITVGGATVTVNLSGLELDAGTYTLNFTGNNTLVGGATITPRITGTTLDLDNFETVGTHVVNGNIYDGSGSEGALDQLNTVDTRLTITGFNSSTATLDPYASSNASASIQGQYGSLQIRADGSYTYTLNNGVSLSSMNAKETFTYQLDDTRGHVDSATLTIDIAPQAIGTAQNDVLIGSAYGDTLIYQLLSPTNGNGGNGADRWSNFSLEQGDKIDISDLLVGWDGQTASLGNYLNVTTSGNNTTIAIDRDGSGTTYQSTTLITLENVQTTLNELIEQNHIITG
ncbi:TPA: BapA/Bap/LapF family large adhesin [Citrobacter freundii]